MLFDKKCKPNMNYFNTFILILNFLHCDTINVEVDGLIDFGPNWSNEYTARPLRSHYEVKQDKANKKLKRSKEINNEYEPNKIVKGRFRNPKRKLKVDEVEKNHMKKEHYPNKKAKYNTYDLYVKPHKVKHNNDVREFINHLYKQNLKVFEIMKRKVNDKKVRGLIDSLAGNYENKFLEFVNETQDQNIRTRLGTRKVILNSVDTSNHILKRLLNYLIGDMDRKGTENNLGATNVFQNEVDKQVQLENKHICTKFAICRTSEGFSNFLKDSITIILSGNNKKLKQGADALTESLKNTDFSNVMDSKVRNKFHEIIEFYEKSEAPVLRAVLVILKNLITYRNKPITVIGDIAKRINKTVAFLDMYDILQSQLPENEANKLEWDDMRNSISEWSEGERNDIEDIMQTFVDHIKRPIDSFDAQTANNFREHLNIMLS